MLRNNEGFEKISSKKLVPGDVFMIEKKNAMIPCDCILIEGEVLMDENSLTGEAIPVPKFEIENND